MVAVERTSCGVVIEPVEREGGCGTNGGFGSRGCDGAAGVEGLTFVVQDADAGQDHFAFVGISAVGVGVGAGACAAVETTHRYVAAALEAATVAYPLRD